MTTFVPQWQDEIDQLRQYLHQHPEPSGEEHNTAAFVCKTLQKLAPSQLIAGIGGTGVIAIFDSGQAGASVLFRTELDALPIQEINTFAHKSVNEGVSHKCGHDGHMAVMLGFAKTIAENPLEKGRAILLFQPAEETGAGAELMLRDPT
ncbi:MAG: M20/M25/M40 family metallo-hydrolase, partial [Mameliella sp.]|nr:M20/M25/M40 family metallo-hydrolase [Phaeodactylibacter sp.]